MEQGWLILHYKDFVHSDALLKENVPPLYAAYNRLVSKKNVQQ